MRLKLDKCTGLFWLAVTLLVIYMFYFGALWANAYAVGLFYPPVLYPIGAEMLIGGVIIIVILDRIHARCCSGSCRGS